MKAQNLNYKQLAKQKQLAFEIKDLNSQREKTLLDLQKLGVSLGQDRVIQGGASDPETIEQELKTLKQFQQNVAGELLSQQVRDVLAQAKEGSRYIHLERKLTQKPQLANSQNLTELQVEQRRYQQKQLEIFDYLEKHFAQFEMMDLNATLPDAGKKFFSQIVSVMQAETQELCKKWHSLDARVEGYSKKLEKLKRQGQRGLEHIQAEVGKKLTKGEVKNSPVLAKKNKAYRQLSGEIKNLEALKTSYLNQLNILLDSGIAQFTIILKKLKSITGQNQVTRGLLYELKNSNELWNTELLKQKIAETMGEFDEQVTHTLFTEIDRRYDRGELSASMKDNFLELVEEVLQFQEYLGQVMMDCYQLMESNLDDLENARWEYGKLVLDFFSV